MRLFNSWDLKSRRNYLAILIFLLIGCSGGSGTQDPILGTPGVISQPQVISTSPSKSIPIVTGVSNNSLITAKFNHSMSASSITALSFTVECPVGAAVAGVVSYDDASQTATFEQTTSLPVTTTCVATITTQVMDIDGVPMAANYVWSFVTGTINSLSPVVVANNPLAGASGVCLTHDVSVTFSNAMDPTTLPNNITVRSPVALMDGSLGYDSPSNTATFRLTSPATFVNGTSYTVTVSSAFKDLQGDGLLQPYVFSFTGWGAACSPVIAPSLGSIATYGAFGGNAGITNSGKNTVVNGNLGTTAACTLFTGFHDASNIYTQTPLNIGDVTGTVYCGPPAPGTDATLLLEQHASDDALTAFNALSLMANTLPTQTPTLLVGELGSVTLIPGIYPAPAGSFIISAGNLTLDAQGNPDAIWVFQMPSSTLTVEPFKQILLINGAKATNVYWQVGSAATIGYGSNMVGTIIASSGITFSTVGQLIQTKLTGRAISLIAAVTMVNTTIVAP